MVLIERLGIPYLGLVALKGIEKGHELRYDYADSNEKLPWRTNVGFILLKALLPNLLKYNFLFLSDI